MDNDPVEELAQKLYKALGADSGASVWRRATKFGDEIWVLLGGDYDKNLRKAWDEGGPFLASRKIDGFKVLKKSWLPDGALSQGLGLVEVSIKPKEIVVE